MAAHVHFGFTRIVLRKKGVPTLPERNSTGLAMPVQCSECGSVMHRLFERF
jgi:hypothetical protein